ncbi:Rieske (2Fe-2S) protein [Phycicoccus sp. BSK3Z-2]|uniref:Cytochrome bc1 complex Rieske iron-sulfur subunit n=1 Tax=Phycicoccus avicenniae TaxID=2828860 RepID=A0A941HZG4_9MICO|nr:Rieske (2Fe-2S) protein [Phycicoccus avicenniae]MBR7742206.1 Rieske (2Fe-2S) protein [Phycicoccus avicenniae]
MSTEHSHGPDSTTATCRCWSRRDSLRAVGVAGAGVAGVGTLAACGSSAEEAADAAGDAASSAAGAAGDAIAAADVPVGGGLVVEDMETVVTQPTEGEYKAFSSVCTHSGCTVGGVADNVISCPCHGSEFDASTGEVLQGPATDPLPEKSVTLDGDGLTIT